MPTRLHKPCQKQNIHLIHIHKFIRAQIARYIETEHWEKLPTIRICESDDRLCAILLIWALTVAGAALGPCDGD